MMQSKAWMVLSLVLTCLISACALSQVYSLTKRQIEYQRTVQGLRIAFNAVLPEADRFVPVTPDSAVWHAFAQDRRIGSVLRVAKRGYGGPVPVTAGIDLEGRIVALRIAGPSEGLKETPGLGLKATEEWFRNQFRGKTAAELRLTKEGGTIEAITGATITSRAVIEALAEGLTNYQELLKP